MRQGLGLIFNSFVTNWEFKILTQLEVNGSDMVLAIVAENFETVT